MNTILIIGTAKNNAHLVTYDVQIWAQKSGEDIEFIYSLKFNSSGYSDLWQVAKDKVAAYYSMPEFQDGGYTRFLDHLIIIKD